MFIDPNIEYLYNVLTPQLQKIEPHFKWRKINNEPLDIELEKVNSLIQNYGFFRSYVINDKMLMMGEYKIALPHIFKINGGIEFLNSVIKVGDGFNGKIVDNILYISYSIKYTPDPIRIISLSSNYLFSFINVSHFYLLLVEILTYYEKLDSDNLNILYQNAYNKNREFITNLMK